MSDREPAAALPAMVEDWRGRGRFLDVDGNQVFVIEAGPSGTTPVFILHGFPGSSFDWRQVVDQVSVSARVVVFDFLGYGLSDKPPAARYSLFEQADLAEGVARALGVARCALVSHDVGDTVAAELLHRLHEGRLGFAIDASVLTNGSIFIDMAELSLGQLALLSMPDEPLSEPLPMEAFRPGLEATFSVEHRPTAEEIDGMLALVRHGGGDRLLPRLIRYIDERRNNQERWTAGLVEYPGPMTALWGEQDPIAVIGMPHHLRELRPATEVVTWPDVGHWPSMEVPDRVAQAILSRL